MTSLTPREIVSELDRFIIGQDDAKRAVAIALRNRWRRKQVDAGMKEEIVPKNILMIGPTGVGKTEIARRLAKLAGAPFIKVEATKFTEIGYVGRDVDSIIRDLVEIAINQLKEQLRKEVEVKARHAAEERILDALVGREASPDTREKFRKKLTNNELGDKEVEIQVLETGSPFPSMSDIPGMPGSQMGVINIGDMLGKALSGERTKTRKMTVNESYGIIMAEESDKLMDNDKIIKDALKLVENDGIVFIDEIDKVCTRNDVRGGEVSREGVQRDLLPLLEGTIIPTKYGAIRTDHVLFIASGAFHMAKPADLLPELQGRLPIRVELKALSQNDFKRILTEPEFSLIKQYTALMAIEDVTLEFTPDSIDEIATLTMSINRDVENIGARRLHTIMEKLLEEVSFTATDTPRIVVNIDAEYVRQNLIKLTQQMDLSKFIL